MLDKCQFALYEAGSSYYIQQTVTTLGQQLWPGVDARWPTVRWYVTKVKAKFTLEQGVKAQEGRRGSALLLLYGYV